MCEYITTEDFKQLCDEIDDEQNISKSEITDLRLSYMKEHVSGLEKFIEHPSVYFLFEKGVLVYIGKSIHLSSRIRQHRDTKVFDEIYHIPIEERMLESVETALITFFQPKLNICKKRAMTEKDEVILQDFCGIVF